MSLPYPIASRPQSLLRDPSSPLKTYPVCLVRSLRRAEEIRKRKGRLVPRRGLPKIPSRPQSPLPPSCPIPENHWILPHYPNATGIRHVVAKLLGGCPKGIKRRRVPRAPDRVDLTPNKAGDLRGKNKGHGRAPYGRTKTGRPKQHRRKATMAEKLESSKRQRGRWYRGERGKPLTREHNKAMDRGKRGRITYNRAKMILALNSDSIRLPAEEQDRLGLTLDPFKALKALEPQLGKFHLYTAKKNLQRIREIEQLLSEMKDDDR